MGLMRYNGLHWDSPVGSTPQSQYSAGQQFSMAFIIASATISFAGCSTQASSAWQNQCTWINQNGTRTGEIVVRLYWPPNGCMDGDPGSTLGQAFYNQIVAPAIDNFGIRNFQVLNELNVEYESSKSRQQLAGDMYNIAYWIKHLAVQNNKGLVYLGFPGPGGTSMNPSNADWANYWNAYKPIILQSTDQGNAYNWLGVHAYANNHTDLTNLMNSQYDSLIGIFPNYPHRWTEYGIPLDGGGYCSLPCTNATAFQNRANDCKTAIQSFKQHVEGGSGPDVWAVCYYIAYDSNAAAQGNADTRYELVLNNSNLGPAQTLAGAF